MADKSDTNARVRAPLQNRQRNAAPDPAAQFKVSGFVVSEEAGMILNDLFAAMEATAFAYDMDQRGSANFDLTGDQVAAVLRSFARLGKQALKDAPMTFGATARRVEG